MAGWLVLPVHAAETEVTIDLGREYTEAVFYVTWENYEQAGTVKLTSPSGKVYSKDKTPDQVYEANGEAIVNVGKRRRRNLDGCGERRQYRNCRCNSR